MAEAKKTEDEKGPELVTIEFNGPADEILDEKSDTRIPLRKPCEACNATGRVLTGPVEVPEDVAERLMSIPTEDVRKVK